MPERGGELPSRIIQCILQNPYSKSPHSRFVFLLNKFRASLGVKSAAEAVPAELIRRIFKVSGVAGEAVAALQLRQLHRHHIAQNFGGSYDD
jgi:hypothetical protein